MTYQKKGYWIVSPLNFSDEVIKERKLGKVLIHDNTLREAEQIPGVTLGVEDKVKIAKALDEVGIHRIELNFGLPHQVQSVIEVLDLNLNADIYATAGNTKSLDLARKHDVKNVLIGGVHIDDWSINNVYHKNKEWATEQYVSRIEYAKQHGLTVMAFFPDATRAEFNYLLQLSQDVKKAGADSIGLADSWGVATPEGVYYMVKTLKEKVGLPIEIHAHNDFGLAVANSLATYRAGGEIIQASVNGLAHNAGNAPTEQIAICLQALYGVDMDLKYEKIYDLCNLVSELTNQPYGYNKPVTGKGIWSYESAGKILSLQKDGMEEVAYPYVPWLVGRQPQFELGKASDVEALRIKLSEIGITVPESKEQALLDEAKKLSIEQKSIISAKELEALAKKYK